MPKITFQPTNTTIEVAEGVALRDAGIQAGVTIASTCGGVASCGLCKVKIVSGGEHLSPINQLEIGKLGNVYFITKERLSCQSLVTGDVTCLVPDEMAGKMERQQRAKDGYRQHLIDRAKARR